MIRGTSRKWKQLHEELVNINIMTEWYEDIIKSNAIKAQRMREESNLGIRFMNRTFNNFIESRDSQAFNACKKYANRTDLIRMDRRSNEFNLTEAAKEDDNRYRNGLIIMGGYGSGKTHLAAAIANELVDKGVMCCFGTLSDHLEKIRQEFNTDKRVYLERMKNVPMLILDDVGKEKATEWSNQILFDVVNFRYEHLLPIVITTNFDMDGLANHTGGAIISRFQEMCARVETIGSDHRNARNR